MINREETALQIYQLFLTEILKDDERTKTIHNIAMEKGKDISELVAEDSVEYTDALIKALD